MLSIDPGINCTGWAVWDNEVLKNCGLSRVKGNKIREHLFHFRDFSERIVIEKPQVYQQRFWKGDPADLIELSVLVGAFVGYFSAVETVLPAVWKKQVPKDVMGKRILMKLTPEERLKVLKPKVLGHPANFAPSLKHNMVDAIGIGLWKLGRI